MSEEESCGGSSVGVGFVILGLGLAVLASVGSTFGLILQKLAQLNNDLLPANQRHSTSGGIIWSKTWWAGLVLLILVPFPLDLIAFGLAPQSLVVPVTGVTLILNQVIAPCILDEKVVCLDWIATGIITVGIVFTTAFGAHCSYTYNIDQTMALFEKKPFHVAESFFVCSMIAAAVFAKCAATKPRRAIAYAYMAGAVGGQMQMLLKATGEVFEETIGGNSEWGSKWECYLLSFGCIILAVVQIQLLNKGLALWTAIKYLPIYNVCLIVSSTTHGAVFYEEYKDLDTLGIVMFPIAVLVIVAGASLLGFKNVGNEASAEVSVEECKVEEPVEFNAPGSEMIKCGVIEYPKVEQLKTHILDGELTSEVRAPEHAKAATEAATTEMTVREIPEMLAVKNDSEYGSKPPEPS